MRRADRLFQIVQYLRGGRLTTADILADKLEVSKRTIYRDIVDLQSSGVPIEGEAGVGYVMRGGYDIPPLMFTADEVMALVAGARLLQAWGGARMAASVEEALVKIEAVLPEDGRSRAERVQVYAPMGEGLDAATRQRIDQFEAAIDRRKRLRISYGDEAGARSERVIWPLGLWFWGKVWTGIAWCELRDDFRMFRLDRMVEIEEVGPYRPERARSLQQFFRDERHRSHNGRSR